MNHWTYQEMRDAFGYTAEEYVWFGGYPGAAMFVRDEERWKSYVIDSLAETTISKDILMLSRVDKPALLKRLFELGSAYSGQILSLTKIMGQLQEAGNTTTLSHYVELLDSAGMLCGLAKYTPDQARQRASIPKWQVQNTAYHSVYSNHDFANVLINPVQWGRHVESAVGAHLVRATKKDKIQLYYWREKSDEMDFVMVKSGKVAGFEVKSGKNSQPDRTKAFASQVKPDKIHLIGTGGMPWEEFLLVEPKEFL
jgi:predicted AAA+ superfamily ATPase